MEYSQVRTIYPLEYSPNNLFPDIMALDLTLAATPALINLASVDGTTHPEYVFHTNAEADLGDAIIYAQTAMGTANSTYTQNYQIVSCVVESPGASYFFLMQNL
jgi:hypothetical protein